MCDINFFVCWFLLLVFCLVQWEALIYSVRHVLIIYFYPYYTLEYCCNKSNIRFRPPNDDKSRTLIPFHMCYIQCTVGGG